MALFNKHSNQHQNSASSNQSHQDISSIKSSMNQASQKDPTNPEVNTKSPEQFVNPFSDQSSTSQPQQQMGSNYKNYAPNTNLDSSSNPVQENTSPSFPSSVPQDTSNPAQSLPSFQEVPMNSQHNNSQQNTAINGGGSQPLPSFQEPPSQFENQTSAQMGMSSQDSSSPSSFNPQGYSNSGEYISKEEVENLIYETTEKILEQEWENLTGKVQKVVDWKSSVESEVESIKEDINTMQEAFSTLEKRLISKLNNYDKSILDVGSEIKALDKVFQKVTPTLVNNVTELGKIAKDLKGVSLQNSENKKDKD